MAPAAAPIPAHKQAFLEACVASGSLTFGTYTLKSGRVSPYFFNSATFHRGALLSALSQAYAHTIAETFNTSSLSTATSNGANTAPEFDVLFGPAYKGIPLAACTVVELAHLQSSRFSNVSYSFNRKEAKTHGDGGAIVGSPLRGKRVCIIDDVITAGTAVREAVDIIRREGGELVGIIVALDRMERGPGEGQTTSTIGEVRKTFGVPVEAILTLDDIIEGLKAGGKAEDIKRLEDYRQLYKAED